MKPIITIVYAFRNRDVNRVKYSLQSLEFQQNKNFEVQFIDYGSVEKNAKEAQKIISNFSFATYHYIAHPGLLWNKSKALNYGIKAAQSDNVFIADVDIVFHKETTKLFEKLISRGKAYLFKLSYLSKIESKNLDRDYIKLKTKHIGKVNGMILAPKEELTRINGFDEFYHFYAYEDMDLFERIKNSGIEILYRDELYFKHIWHKIYNSLDDSKLTKTPRLFNAKRINKEHFNSTENGQKIIPENSQYWGTPLSIDDYSKLNNPDVSIKLYNYHEEVIYFFENRLKQYKGKIVEVNIHRHPSYRSMKFYLRKSFGRSNRHFISMKNVNDIILLKILFSFRDYNYNFRISDDLKRITFTIQL